METHDHTHQSCSCNEHGPELTRRGFLAMASSAVMASQIDMIRAASCLAAEPGKQADKRPVFSVVFVRPLKAPVVSWPGGQADVGAMQALFATTLAEAAAKLGAQLDIRNEPLENKEMVNAYLEQIKQSPLDGLIVCAMELTHWPEVYHLAQNRGDVPTIVYSNMTSFTENMKATRQLPKTFVGATPDVNWLKYAVRMLNALWRMKHTRLAILVGDESKEVMVERLGTMLHYLPAARFDEELAKVEVTDEVKAMADQYAKNAQEIAYASPAGSARRCGPLYSPTSNFLRSAVAVEPAPSNRLREIPAASCASMTLRIIFASRWHS